MGSSQDAWQEMERGVCEICNKVRRVCREDGCNGSEKVAENTTILPTVAKNATLDYAYPIMLRFNHSLSDEEVQQIEEAINSMFRIF